MFLLFEIFDFDVFLFDRTFQVYNLVVLVNKLIFYKDSLIVKLDRFLLELLVFFFEHDLSIFRIDISLVISCKQLELSLVVLLEVCKRVILLFEFILLL